MANVLNLQADHSGFPAGKFCRRVRSGMLLMAPRCRVVMLYFESYMGQVLEVGFSSKKIRKTILSESMLFVP